MRRLIVALIVGLSLIGCATKPDREIAQERKRFYLSEKTSGAPLVLQFHVKTFRCGEQNRNVAFRDFAKAKQRSDLDYAG